MRRNRKQAVRSADVFEVARQKFLETYADRTIPDDIAKRLSISALREGKYWVVHVSLQAVDPSTVTEGLWVDLILPRPRVLVAIRVDTETGEAVLEEMANVPW